MESSSAIINLRDLLATRFPHLRMGVAPAKLVTHVVTGVDPLDTLLGGGLPRGEFTELIASGHGSGSAEVIHELLRTVAANRQFLVLVDGLGSFDPGAVEPAVLHRLLWIRCRQTTEALKATDLLLRDRNCSILVLDLKLNALRELRKVSASIWYRYARLLEQNQSAVLVITPQQIVSGASSRIAIESGLGMNALEQSRAERLACLRFRLVRSVSEAGVVQAC